MVMLVQGNINGFTDTADAEVARHCRNELRVLGGARTHLMVQVCRKQPEGKGFVQPPERMQQRHRIGATRDGDEQGIAALEHLVVLDRLLYLLKEGLHSCGVQGMVSIEEWRCRASNPGHADYDSAALAN